MTLRYALRTALDGLPKVSAGTICAVLSEMQNYGKYGKIAYGRHSRDNDQYADEGNALRLCRQGVIRRCVTGRMGPVGWEALEQWGDDVARIAPLAGGVANDVWTVRVHGH